MQLLSLPNEWQKNTNIPVEKIFCNPSDDTRKEVKSISWYGCVKPNIAEVKSTITETLRYEEIHLFEIEVSSRNSIYEVANTIAQNIKYPCVIEYKIDEVIVVGICTFKAGKKESSDNVYVRPVFSHFLRPDCLSTLAKNQIGEINEALVSKGTIGEIYQKIYNAIYRYPMGGISRGSVDLLIKDMLGKTSAKRCEEIRRFCVPYEFHKPKYKYGKYKGNKDANYTLVHDREEVWYCFMQDPEVRRIVELRRYKNIEELIYSIENKDW